MTSAQDLRELNEEDLRKRERDLYDQLFRLRVQKAMAQLDAPSRIREIRRDLARVKTVLRQMGPAGAGKGRGSARGTASRAAEETDVKS
jgi:large subunit ribosomal protein L29